MFTVKHAIMEILNKSKTLDEVLEVLNTEDQVMVLAAFDLMKAKLGGSIDTMDTQDNGQWSLSKNTLDYSKMNAPKPSNEPATLDYSKINAPKPRNEPANTLDYSKMNSPAAKRAGAGAVARRDAARAKHQEWIDAGSKGGGETNDKPAMNAMRDRTSKSDESDVQQIKDKYAEKKPKAINEMVADVKEKYGEKKPKSDSDKVTEAKNKFRQDEKLKAEAPIKTATKLTTPKKL